MKQSLKAYAFSLAFLLAAHFISANVLSSLYYYHLINIHTYNLVLSITAVIIMVVSGIVLGSKVNKKALFHALPVVIILLLWGVLRQDMSMAILLYLLTKTIAYVFGAVLGRSLFHHF